MTRVSISGVGLGIVLLTLLTSPARAQSAAATAQALFDDGKRLMQSGKFAEACPKFEESQRLDAGAGTLIYLADCYQRTNRTASAWATFLEGAAAAHTAGELDREKFARSRAAALEPKLAKLVIDVPKSSDVAGLVISRGGTAVAKPLWGTPLPVDAGQQTIRAEAPGHKPWTTRVQIIDGAQPLHIQVPLLEPTPATAATPQEPNKQADGAPAPVPREEHGTGRVQRTAGFVTAGLGVVAAGVGSWFWLHAHSQHNDALSHCKPNCDATARSLQTDAKHSVTAGNVAVIGGAILVAGGVTLVLTAPSGKPTAEIRLSPQGIEVAGAFR